MKRFVLFISSLFVAFSIVIPSVHAEQDKQIEDKAIELTEEQKNELGQLHKEILEKKFEMIEKHVEYGVISEEKGEQIKEKLNKRLETLKENGYVPTHKSKMHKKDCHGHS